jgi:hypothetical protein
VDGRSGLCLSVLGYLVYILYGSLRANRNSPFGLRQSVCLSSASPTGCSTRLQSPQGIYPSLGKKTKGISPRLGKEVSILHLSLAYRLKYSSTITSGHIPLAWEKNKRYIPLIGRVFITPYPFASIHKVILGWNYMPRQPL